MLLLFVRCVAEVPWLAPLLWYSCVAMLPQFSCIALLLWLAWCVMLPWLFVGALLFLPLFDPLSCLVVTCLVEFFSFCVWCAGLLSFRCAVSSVLMRCGLLLLL